MKNVEPHAERAVEAPPATCVLGPPPDYPDADQRHGTMIEYRPPEPDGGFSEFLMRTLVAAIQKDTRHTMRQIHILGVSGRARRFGTDGE